LTAGKGIFQTLFSEPSLYATIFSMKEMRTPKFFGIILNSVADGVFTISNQSKITFMNEAAERITGYTRSEALGRNCFDIFRRISV